MVYIFSGRIADCLPSSKITTALLCSTESDLQRGVKARFDWSSCTPWTTSYDQSCQLGRATWQWKRLERGGKRDTNWELENHLYKLTDLLTSKSLTKPVSSNPNIQKSSNIWCCFLELGSNYSFSNQTVQSRCEQTSVQTTVPLSTFFGFFGVL